MFLIKNESFNYDKLHSTKQFFEETFYIQYDQGDYSKQMCTDLQ